MQESGVAESRPWEAVEPDSPPPRRYVNPPPPAAQEGRQETRQDSARRLRPSSQSSPAALSDPRQSESIFDQPLPPESSPPSPPPATQRHPLRRPSGERRPPLSDAGLKDFRNVVSEANELGGASARAEKSARDAYAAVPAPAQDLDRPQRSQDRPQLDRPQYDRSQHDRSEPRMFEPQAPQERKFEPPGEPRPHDDFSEPMLEHLRHCDACLDFAMSVGQMTETVEVTGDAPLLQTENPRASLAEMLQKRTPLYEKVADLRIETTKLTHDEVADMILSEVEKRNA